MSGSRSSEKLVRADFDSVYDELRNMVEDGTLDVGDVASLTPLVMNTIRLVERISKSSGYKGEQKKQLALRLMERLVNELNVDSTVKATLLLFIDQAGPALIDGFIAVDRGQLLEHGRKGLRALCSCFGASGK